MSRADELYARLKREGEVAIDALIADYQSENLWLDFKRSADGGAGTKINQDDRENFAKALSGFANSDGGVIVWGVDCRRDKSGADLPSTKLPLQHPHRFVTWLENVLSGCVAPAAPGVEHAVIPTQANLNEGYVVTLIPSSMTAPHQCIQPSNNLRYYMRAGSNFLPVPHAVLAGMFGRRPQPHLSTFYDARPRLLEGNVLDVDLGIGLVNEGPIPAVGVYLTARLLLQNQNCRVNFKPRSPETWDTQQSYGCYFNSTAKAHFRLAPHIPVHPMRFQLQFAPPFTESYVFDISYGGDATVPGHYVVTRSPVELQEGYGRAVDVLRTATSSDDVMEVLLPWLVESRGYNGAA